LSLVTLAKQASTRGGIRTFRVDRGLWPLGHRQVLAQHNSHLALLLGDIREELNGHALDLPYGLGSALSSNSHQLERMLAQDGGELFGDHLRPGGLAMDPFETASVRGLAREKSRDLAKRTLDAFSAVGSTANESKMHQGEEDECNEAQSARTHARTGLRIIDHAHNGPQN
jgi:hypothetical protein